MLNRPSHRPAFFNNHKHGSSIIENDSRDQSKIGIRNPRRLRFALPARVSTGLRLITGSIACHAAHLYRQLFEIY
jgi:hypothetical protein